MSTLWSVAAVALATVQKGPDPNDVKPGWLGFGVFLALAAAVVLLVLSMRRHLKKVDFPVEPEPERRGSTDGPSTTQPRPRRKS